MRWFEALILGLVQGLGEFLPISSSGHLVLAREIMGISGDYLFFDVMLHVGTLLTILVFFFKDILALFKPPFKTIGLIILASIPAVIVALLFDDKIESFFAGAKYLCFFFLFTAIMMFVTELIAKRMKGDKPLGVKTAVFMGLMQSVALFPGVSRSGSTIFGGTLAGAKRESVAKFSFFMSVPVILGSALLETIKIDSLAAVEWGNVLIGMAASFLSGLFAVKLMMKLIAKANFKWFGVYLLAVSVLSFAFFYW